MAYTDLGALAPSETQQGASHLAAARAEGTKQATYLASMDQFYAGLEASQEMQDKEIAANREQWVSYLGHETAKLAKQDEWETAMQAYRSRSLDITEQNAQAQLAFSREELARRDEWENMAEGYRQRALDIQETTAQNQLAFSYAEAARQEEHDDAMDAYRVRSADIQERSVAAQTAYGTRQLDLQDKWNTADDIRDDLIYAEGTRQFDLNLAWQKEWGAIQDENEDLRRQAQIDIAAADRESRERIANAQLDLQRDMFDWDKVESQWMMDQYAQESGTGSRAPDIVTSRNQLSSIDIMQIQRRGGTVETRGNEVAIWYDQGQFASTYNNAGITTRMYPAVNNNPSSPNLFATN